MPTIIVSEWESCVKHWDLEVNSEANKPCGGKCSSRGLCSATVSLPPSPCLRNNKYTVRRALRGCHFKISGTELSDSSLLLVRMLKTSDVTMQVTQEVVKLLGSPAAVVQTVL